MTTTVIDDLLPDEAKVEPPEEPPPPPKARKERPARDWAELDLPPLPNKKANQRIDSTVAFEWLEKVQPTAWVTLKIFVYRNMPVIDRDPKHIERFEGEQCKIFSLNYLRANHGGGNYTINVNLMTGGDCLFYCIVDIDMGNFPPIINISELADSPKNERYITNQIRKGKLRYENGKLVEANEGDNKPMAVGANPSEVMEQATKLFEKGMQAGRREPAPDKSTDILLQMLLSQAEDRKLLMQQQAEDRRQFALQAAEASKANQTIMMELLREARQPPPAPPAPDNSFKEFMAMQLKTQQEELKAQREQNTALLSKLMEQKPANPFTNIIQTMEMIETLKASGGGAEEPKDWKDKLIDIAGMLAPAVIGGLGAQRQGLPAEHGIAAVMNPATPSLNGGFTIAEPAAIAPPANVIPIRPDNPIEQILLAQGPLIANKINANQRGWEFADDLIKMFGRPAYNEVANSGPEPLLAAMKKVTQFRQLVGSFSDEYLAKWVGEFVNYDEEMKKLEEGEEEN